MICLKLYKRPVICYHPRTVIGRETQTYMISHFIRKDDPITYPITDMIDRLKNPNLFNKGEEEKQLRSNLRRILILRDKK